MIIFIFFIKGIAEYYLKKKEYEIQVNGLYQELYENVETFKRSQIEFQEKMKEYQYRSIVYLWAEDNIDNFKAKDYPYPPYSSNLELIIALQFILFVILTLFYSYKTDINKNKIHLKNLDSEIEILKKKIENKKLLKKLKNISPD